MFTDKREVSIIIFVVFILLDALGGYVAARCDCITKFGKNFDIIADGFMFVAAYAILFFQHQLPRLYSILLLIVGVVNSLLIISSFILNKGTFISSSWKKLNETYGYLGIFFILLQTSFSFTVAYILLVGSYVGAAKFSLEIYQRYKDLRQSH